METLDVNVKLMVKFMLLRCHLEFLNVVFEFITTMSIGGVVSPVAFKTFVNNVCVGRFWHIYIHKPMDI